MRVVTLILALLMLACVRPAAESIDVYWAKYKEGMEQSRFTHLWPATQAGCLVLEGLPSSAGNPPPAFPDTIQLDTSIVIIGIPEPVGYRRVRVTPFWAARFQDARYWMEGMLVETDSAVAITLEQEQPWRSIALKLHLAADRTAHRLVYFEVSRGRPAAEATALGLTQNPKGP